MLIDIARRGASVEKKPIEFVSSSTIRVGTSSNFNAPKPSDVFSGNLLLAFYSHNQSATLTPPSGWSSLYNGSVEGGTLGVFSLIAGSSEPDNYVFRSTDSSNQRVSIANFKFGNDAVDVFGSIAGASSGAISAPSISVGQAGLLLAYSSAENNPQTLTSGPSGMTELFLYQDLAPRATLYAEYVDTGTTGDKTFTWSNSGSRVAFLMSIY